MRTMHRVGTVRVAVDTPCAVCGGRGVEMAFRNDGESFAYHQDCWVELCEAVRRAVLRMRLQQVGVQ